ncbi:hypothetical protein J2S49_001003 [Arcanobacterium wilhelmae]|uniref:Phage protein n=1 Tax=Arcanobacterium wilhelmae TaxID=1803177 RepID=A0ABT9NB84_9ACTO|nr:hypothetical protein [Arcanobacterium wilhelmae]MDP9800927.1 hypothetical protein [Arcanobacterium wilhelmae]WFN90288.1 hypothetical protein P8A24_00055 [Arcanobacterium wilhelmae]
MTIDELKEYVNANAKYRDSYSIDEGLKNDALIIEQVHGRFVIYYYERGSRSSEKWFDTEEAAVAYFLHDFKETDAYRTKRVVLV